MFTTVFLVGIFDKQRCMNQFIDGIGILLMALHTFLSEPFPVVGNHDYQRVAILT